MLKRNTHKPFRSSCVSVILELMKLDYIQPFDRNYGYESLFKTHRKSIFHHEVSYVKGLITLLCGSNMR